MLAFGQQRFVAGPMILTDLMTECNLEGMFSYRVMAQGDMTGLTALAELLKKNAAQEHPAHLEAMKLSRYHWINCSLFLLLGCSSVLTRHSHFTLDAN